MEDDTNSNASETGRTTDEAKNTKKLKRKKKIRHTQELNAMETGNNSDVGTKKKSKKTKKKRMPSFLPPVDMIDEDKNIHLATTSGNSTTDSDNKENTSTSEGDRNVRRGRTKRTKKGSFVNKMSYEALYENGTDNTLSRTQTINNSAESNVNKTNTKTPRLRREGTFEISSMEPEKLCSADLNDMSGLQIIHTRDTYDLVPSASHKSLRICKQLSTSSRALETVDLTDSITELGPSSETRAKRSTFDRNSSDIKNNLVEIVDLTDSLVELRSNSAGKSKRGTFVKKSPKCQKTIEINKPSTSKKLKRSTFDKNVPECERMIEINNPSTSKKLKRSTFDKNVPECETMVAINNPSTSKKLKRSTFDKNVPECETMVEINNPSTSKKLKRSTFDKNVPECERMVEINKPSTSKKLKRSTFDKNVPECETMVEINKPSTSKKLKRSTFDKNVPECERMVEINKPSTIKKLKRSTFDKNVPECETMVEINKPSTSKKLNRSTFDKNVPECERMVEINKPSTIKKLKRSTFDKNVPECETMVEINKPSTSKKLNRSTFDKNVPECERMVEINKPSTSKKLNRSTFDKEIPENDESVEITKPSRSMNLKRSRSDKKIPERETIVKIPKPGSNRRPEHTFDDNRKSSVEFLEKRNSSFELSFNNDKEDYSPEIYSNVTTRNRRRSFCKSSTTEFTYSTDHIKDEESPCDSSESPASSKSMTVKKISSKKSTLKKSLGRSTRNFGRDTFEVMEDFFKSQESLQIQMSPTSGDQLFDTARTGDIFHFVSKTPTAELDRLMIGNEELSELHQTVARRSSRKRWSQAEKTPVADIMSSECIKEGKSPCNSSESPTSSKSMPVKKNTSKKSILKKSLGCSARNFGKDTSTVTSEQLFNTARAGDIFQFVSKMPTTELDRLMIGNEELAELHQTVARRSSRKRWSQAEKTPVADIMSSAKGNQSKLDASVNVTKSVSFYSPPYVTPTKSRTKLGESKPREIKSVKIQSPLTTPKMRLHSPLVARKTPKPAFSLLDNSNQSANCAFSRKPFASHPSCTSTPYQSRKEESLLKKVLTNEKSSKTSRVKVPNFRKIHERRFEKMENIRELQERKAIRAQYLLSGCKVPENKEVLRSGDKEVKKKLFIPLKTDQEQKPVASKVQNVATSKISKPMQLMMDKKRTSLEKKKKDLRSKVPVLIPHFSPLKALQPKVGSSKAVLKPDIRPETKAVSKYGFKLQGKNNLSKEEQIKAIATKTKVVANRTDHNRKQVAVVRSNRRFDLLMQMRAKEK